MGRLASYNPAEVSVIVGARPIKGFASGTFISAERDEQSFTKQVGADGEVTRSKTSNKGGRVTITLQQASESNEYLSTLLATDEVSATGVIPLLVRDASGTTLLAAESAWIQKPPTTEFGRDPSEREWVIDCANLEMFVGSN